MRHRIAGAEVFRTTGCAYLSFHLFATGEANLQDELAGYFAELTQTRDMLASRYDDLNSGRVKPFDGEEAFAVGR